MRLKYESEPLPECLENKRFRCNLHCYDPVISYNVLELLKGKDIFRISACRRNMMTGELYPSRQAFFVGDENILKVLNSAIDDNHVKSAWVDTKEEIHWADYFDIDISYPGNNYNNRIKYHQTL